MDTVEYNLHSSDDKKPCKWMSQLKEVVYTAKRRGPSTKPFSEVLGRGHLSLPWQWGTIQTKSVPCLRFPPQRALTVGWTKTNLSLYYHHFNYNNSVSVITKNVITQFRPALNRECWWGSATACVVFCCEAQIWLEPVGWCKQHRQYDCSLWCSSW